MSTTPATPAVDTSSAAAGAKKPPASSSQQRSGRRPSAVWEFFAAIRTEHNTVHAQCRFCARQCAGVASRMAQHILTKCANAPREAVDALGGDAAIAAVAAGKKRKSIGVAGGGENGEKTQVSRATVKKKKSASPVLMATAHAASDEPSAIPATTTGIGAAGTNSISESGEIVLRSEQQAVTTAQQKLVLACVLNDVPLSFVEDAALMDAFEALKPGFPRLSKDRAETEVLSQVHRNVIEQIDAAFREKQQFAVLHCRIPRQLHDLQGVSTLVDVWTGVEDRREPPILLAEMSSDVTVPEPRRHSLLLQEAETILSARLARLTPTAVLSVCTESPRLYSQLHQLQAKIPSDNEDKDTAPATDPRLRSVMLGTCMLHQTMRLQRELLQSASAVMALLQEATMLLCALAHHPKNTSARVHEALQDVMACTETSRWDLHFRTVHRLLSVEADVRALFQELAATAAQNEEEAAVSPATLPLPRASFWDELRELHALLAPFSWAFALSESESTTSAQYLLLWLWLLSVSSTTSTSANPLLSEDQRDAFVAHTMGIVRQHVDDHQLASLLLDPRVHGAGLSALGKRKVKTLVVHVAERVFVHDQFHVVGTATRTNLLAHLGHYAEKTAQFGDTIAWEMSAGNAPQVFWNDYVDDARELAKVARAILAFAPQTQSARGYFQQQQQAAESGETQSQSQEESLCVRQIKQFYNKQQPQQPRYKTTDDVMKAYATLLLPIGGPEGSKSHDQASSGSNTAAPSDGQSSASRLLIAMAQHMQLLLSIHDDDGNEDEAATQDNAEPQCEQQQETTQSALANGESASSSATSPGSKDPTTSGDSDAVAQELPPSVSASAPPPAAAAVPGSTGLAIDESWFAFRSAKERSAIEAAIARFFSGAATLAIV